MKRLLLLLVVTLTTFSGFAQRTISGKIMDDELKEPVIQATVALLGKDSALVANAVSNMNGQFSLTAPKDGNYTVKVTYVGYKTYTRAITVSGKPVQLGTITIKPDAIMLKGATVTGQAAKVTVKEDTFVYNASAYRTPEGSVVEELVKRLPGAEVSDDGTIKINGKEVKKILVDGKEFMTGDTKTAMKNLPTNIIDRIKAYDQQSDLTRISGIDDGEEQTVLDFGIKPGMNRGFMTNNDIGIGTRSRYSGRTFNGLMSQDMTVMLMASANNVNDMGFGGGGFGGGFGMGRQGLTATKMVGVNMNYEKKDKLVLDGSVRWNHSDGDALSKGSTETFYSQTVSKFGNSTNQNYSRRNNWDAQMRIEWTPDSMTNIMFRPNFRYNNSDGQTTGQNATFESDPYLSVEDPLSQIQELKNLGLVNNYQVENSISYSDNKNVGGMLQLNRKLNNSGRNITLQLNGNWSEGMSKSLSNSNVMLMMLDSTYQTNRYSLTPTDNYSYSTRLTYSEPIMKRTYLQFSYTYGYSYQKSDRETFDLTDVDFSGLYPSYGGWESYLGRLVNPLESYKSEDLSRFSEYKNYTHTAEVMLRIIRNSYTFNVGFQVIPQKSHYIQDYQGIHADTTRTVTNFTPTLDFRWKKSQVGQLRFNYRGRSQQPSITDLLDIYDDSNPLAIRTGNPGLKPSFTQNFRLNYNDYFQKHQQSIGAFVNFSTTSNSVSTKTTLLDSSTGKTMTRPENINGNWNTMAFLMFTSALDSAAYFNVNTMTNLSYDHRVGYVSMGMGAESQESVTNSFGIGERLATSYRNDWLEIELNGSVNYQRNRSELQTANNLDTWQFSYGGMVGINAPWGTSLTTNINMQSRRGYNDNSMNTNELIWNAQISQSFLRGNALTVSLQLYDILHQQSTVSRAITASQRSDTEYNAITNYAMLHVIYRMNLFGGGQGGFFGMGGNRGNRGGQRGGFGGPGGGGPRGGGFGGGFGGGPRGGRF
jgi:hypothetical protein